MTDEPQKYSKSRFFKTGSRKFSLAFIALTVGSVALFLGKIDGSQYNYLVFVTLGAYGAANVTDKMNGGHG